MDLLDDRAAALTVSGNRKKLETLPRQARKPSLGLK